MARSFTDTLRDLRAGSFAEEASDKLAALVKAVADSGKPGKITVELTIKRMSRAAGAVIVTDKLAVKWPEQAGSETMMFDTPEGSLVVNNPKQNNLDLKVAAQPDERAPLKVASEG